MPRTPKKKSPSADATRKNVAGADTVLSLPLPVLKQRVEKAREHLRALGELLPELVTMTVEDRLYSAGKMREGESAALLAVLDAVDQQPAPFGSLGDVDEGHDPGRFETALLRERLARRDALAPLAAELTRLADGVSDTTLLLAGQTRPAVLAAYRIAKALAATDRKLRTALSPALDFYAAPARKALATRNKNRKPA